MIGEIIALVLAAALLLGSPGPAPLALAATGASFGVRQGIPFLVGILIGLLMVCVCTAIGFHFVIEINTVVKSVVQVLGGGYFLYVAYKIACGPVSLDEQNSLVSAPSVIDGFVLNVFNPKAYAAFFVLFSQFILITHTSPLNLIYTGLISLLVAVVVDLFWLMVGGTIRSLFRKPKSARCIRLFFAALMLLVLFLASFS